MKIYSLLNKTELTKEDIITLLLTQGKEETALFEYSAQVKQNHVGNRVFLRGLIELSNFCKKDCYYCGIRNSNRNIHRYRISEDELLELVKYAYIAGFGSIAFQSGEIQSEAFTESISNILEQSMKITNNEIGITLSCGEQSEETYQQWYNKGAIRYLLRIETSNRELYRKLHPDDASHAFENRINALLSLKSKGYQTGTGVMIGLPFQTIEDLADDLLFMKQLDIDMCGMGPYIEHRETPLFTLKNQLRPQEQRLNLSLKMISILRILMPEINIAATTAMQTIDKEGRMRAIEVGANILMPNITPYMYRKDYFLYDNKNSSPQNKNEDKLIYLERQLQKINHQIEYFHQGNSLHFRRKRL